MSFDLTNKNIQDTFQNLLQRTGSDNRLYDLTGNEIGNLRISGSLIAQQYIVSSSVTNITTQQLSGSTQFGDTSDDTHQFTGHITASGNISASGTINASQILANGNSVVTDVGTSATQGTFTETKGGVAGAITLTDLGTTGNPIFNHITASGDISASGDVFAHSGSFNYITASIIDVDGSTIRMGGEPFTKENIQALKQGKSLKALRPGKVNPDILGGDITASGDIKINGDILNTETFQMTATSDVINTFNTGSHQTCKYLLQVTSGSFIQSSEMLVMQNSSNAFNTEYAQINSGLNLVDFSSKVNGANIELIGSSSFISCSIKFNRVLI